MKRKRTYSGTQGRARKKRRISTRRRSARPSGYSMKPELKGMDTEMEFTQIPNTTSDNTFVSVLNLVQQGTGSWNRIGRKIKPKTLRITGTAIHADLVTAVSNNVLRMVIVYDKQPSGDTIPNYDDIFGHTEQDGTTTTFIFDPVQYNEMGRFRILKDCRYNLNVPSTGAVSGTTQGGDIKIDVDEYIKLAVPETVFNGTADPMTIANVNTGAIYCYFRGYEPTVTDQIVTQVSLLARLRYSDM